MKKIFTCYGRLISVCSARQKVLRSPQLLAMLICLFMFPAIVFAQGNKITGKVVDDANLPLPGVTVMVKGTNYGVVTDVNGNYSINADKGATLSFSFVGYAPKDVLISDQHTLDVKLAQVQANLQEVVVVGYGEQKKLSLTTAVSSITSKELVETKNENVENMLTGKIPGLQVMQNTAEPGDFNDQMFIR